MMPNPDKENANRIPVRFMDEDETSSPDDNGQAKTDAETNDEALSPEELGRASSYEDATEMQRRIDRGKEEDSGAGRSRADDADTAGGPKGGERPERREDQDEAGAAPTKEMGGSFSSGREQQQGASSGSESASGPAVAELVATRAELKRVEAERADLLDQLARRQADFENYRKRVERDRTDMYNRMVGDVVSKLLPVLDNLRRALDTEASQQAGESKEFRHFLQGVELIYKQLSDVLESLGLQPVAALGERFDPHVHEAVLTEHTEEYEPDTVIQELVRGYRLGEKLLRPAIVKVATR
ncbi:MAG TPA: nucleotide exchange factor GrpE [Pyrinomonadaceae bacterium]|jgi:molecular chaperone GrpE